MHFMECQGSPGRIQTVSHVKLQHMAKVCGQATDFGRLPTHTYSRQLHGPDYECHMCIETPVQCTYTAVHQNTCALGPCYHAHSQWISLSIDLQGRGELLYHPRPV
jgi:hypothetical protein